MLRTILILLLLVSTSLSKNLDEIVSYALDSHNSLKVIETRLSIVDDSVELTKNFTNPIVSFTVSDIQLDDISNRSLEPMQFTSLSFKQKVPYFGKRAAKKALAKAKKDVVYGSLKEAKVALVKKIKLTAYTIWEYEQKLHVTDKKIDLIKQSIELYSAYSSSGSGAMMDVTNSKLRLLEFEISKTKIKSTMMSLFKSLSYLSSQNITFLNLHVEIGELKTFNEYLIDLEDNHSYKKELAKVKEKNSLVKVRDLDLKVDPFVSVGYFYREDRKDYVSLSVGAALPIYGSETTKSQQARKELLLANVRSSDMYEKLSAELAESYAKLKSSYEVYKIIDERSIAEIGHMSELSESMLKSGKNLLQFLDLQEKRLSLEERKYMALASFKRHEAKIESLIGEMK